MRVGIIGNGAFGSLLAELTSNFASVVVYDELKHTKTNKVATVSEISSLSDCDLIILAVHLEKMTQVCRQLVPVVNSNVIVMDVCSVKEAPAKILESELSGSCRVVATHPLFGPQTIKSVSDAEGQTMIWCNINNSDTSTAENLFFNKLKLKKQVMTPSDHDQQMAWAHGLTFFVGRTLLDLGVPKDIITTGYFDKLLDLVKVESEHTMELFMTIQKGNKYAGNVRELFLKEARKLDRNINLPEEHLT